MGLMFQGGVSMIINLNYNSPVAWDDLGMDWTDENKISSQNSIYIDAVRLAVLERYDFISRMTGFFSYNCISLWFPSYIPTPGVALDSKLLIGIHNAIRDLIPKFANHYILNQATWNERQSPNQELSNGYLYGYFLPNWDEQSLLQYLNIEQYEYPQSWDGDNTLWLIQQYKILNELKFIPLQVYGAPILGFSGEERSGTSSTLFDSSNNAVDDAISVSTVSVVTSVTGQPPEHFTNVHYYEEPYYKYIASALSTNLTAQLQLSAGLKVNLENLTIDCYALARPPRYYDSAYYTHIKQFNSNGFYVEGSQLLFSDLIFDENRRIILPPIPGEELDNFPKYPDTPLDYIDTMMGYSLALELVLKPDFKFIA